MYCPALPPRSFQRIDRPPPLPLALRNLLTRLDDGPDVDMRVVGEQLDPQTLGQYHLARLAAGRRGTVRLVDGDGKGLGRGGIPVQRDGRTGRDGGVVPECYRIGPDLEGGESDGLLGWGRSGDGGDIYCGLEDRVRIRLGKEEVRLPAAARRAVVGRVDGTGRSIGIIVRTAL